MYNKYESKIAFVEKPVTDAELEIHEFLQSYFQAFQKRRVADIMGCFADDAVIQSALFRTTSTKGQLQEFLSANMTKFHALRLDNILIRSVDKDHATVYVDIVFFYDDKTVGPVSRLWRMEKNGRWLIVKSEIIPATLINDFL